MQCAGEDRAVRCLWIVNVQPEGDHELLAIELCSNRTMLPQLLKGEPLELGKKHAFTVKQPESPALDCAFCNLKGHSTSIR